jgi:hypothetical protein
MKYQGFCSPAEAICITDTYVDSHMGSEAANHSLMSSVDTFKQCHTDAKDYHINGVVADQYVTVAQLKSALTSVSLLDKDGDIVVGTIEAAKAGAWWNYLLVAVEDKSHGVHNMPYAETLVDSALAALK